MKRLLVLIGALLLWSVPALGDEEKQVELPTPRKLKPKSKGFDYSFRSARAADSGVCSIPLREVRPQQAPYMPRFTPRTQDPGIFAQPPAPPCEPRTGGRLQSWMRHRFMPRQQ
jgi:hypothetical protein